MHACTPKRKVSAKPSLPSYMHTCTKGYIHAYVHKGSHIRIHALRVTYTHTNSSTHTCSVPICAAATSSHTYIHSRLHTCIQTQLHVVLTQLLSAHLPSPRIHTYIHSRLHTCIQTQLQLHVLLAQLLSAQLPSPGVRLTESDEMHRNKEAAF
jgi:hypothetical protein